MLLGQYSILFFGANYIAAFISTYNIMFVLLFNFFFLLKCTSQEKQNMLKYSSLTVSVTKFSSKKYVKKILIICIIEPKYSSLKSVESQSSAFSQRFHHMQSDYKTPKKIPLQHVGEQS